MEFEKAYELLRRGYRIRNLNWSTGLNIRMENGRIIDYWWSLRGDEWLFREGASRLPKDDRWLASKNIDGLHMGEEPKAFQYYLQNQPVQLTLDLN